MFKNVIEMMKKNEEESHEILKQIVMSIITEGSWHRESYANDIATSILKNYVVMDKTNMVETIAKLKARGN